MEVNLDFGQCGKGTVEALTPSCTYKPNFYGFARAAPFFAFWPIELFRSYMVDAADRDKLDASRNELHSLIDKPQLMGIPVLVLGNKRDLPSAVDEKDLIDRMWVPIYEAVSFLRVFSRI